MRHVGFTKQTFRIKSHSSKYIIFCIKDLSCIQTCPQLVPILSNINTASTLISYFLIITFNITFCLMGCYLSNDPSMN
jgi:hypothetical protein